MKKFILKSYINTKISKSVTGLMCDNMWNVVKNHAWILEDYVNDVQNRNMVSAGDLSVVFIEKDIHEKFSEE